MIDASVRNAWQDIDQKVRPFVARRVPGAANVDDVIQDVYLRMQRGLGQLRDDQRFGPWVYQVTRSAIADHQRSKGRRAQREQPLPEHEEVAANAADDERTIECDLARAVVPFVASLPSPYREAITLTELEGMSQVEAAALLGISVSGMKSRVQRGRKLLREALDTGCKIALDARGGVVSCERRTTPDAKRECSATKC